MAGYLDMINKMIADHQAIKHQFNQAGEQINDFEALFALQGCCDLWTESSMDSLLEKQKKLQKMRLHLYNSLKKHFDLEEHVLPPLLGKKIMGALVLVHRMIKKEFRQVELAMAVKLDGAKPEELSLYKSRVEKAVYHLCQLIEQHASHEEVLLNILKQVLELSGYKPGKKRLVSTGAGAR